MNLSEIKRLLDGQGIIVSDIIENNKSSEKYIKTKFVQSNGFSWETYVPYYSRWSALFIEKEEDMAAYLMSLKQYFTEEKMKQWREKEWGKWESNRGNVTKYVFKVLLSFKGEYMFPLPGDKFSDNPAKRIQEIKNAGYTLSSVMVNIDGSKKTKRYLLPIPLNNELGYETFTPQFKKRVIRLLREINAYEAKPTSVSSLIPDHKFSEIRWDDETKAENPMDMTDDEIIEKFQLLDNQRNQQKREVCRRCFQEGIRGSIFGINFFYEGTEVWDRNIPAVGKVAEAGCKGCPWYDIETWRNELNKKIKGRNED